MKVEHLAEGVTLYLADCRDVLPLIEGVDAVICDPPYGMRKDFANDDPAVADALVSDVIEWSRENAKGNVLAFWSAQRLAEIERIFKPKRTMIWNKTFALYAPHNVGYRFEPLVWVSGAKAVRKRGDIFQAFPIAFKAQAENEAHPTQKPRALMAEIVADFTDENAHVVDPFMGTGTTGVAAVGLGRRFTGCEVEEKYFDIARRRISAELASYKQEAMFA